LRNPRGMDDSRNLESISREIRKGNNDLTDLSENTLLDVAGNALRNAMGVL
jgi:hypothetical protein